MGSCVRNSTTVCCDILLGVPHPSFFLCQSIKHPRAICFCSPLAPCDFLPTQPLLCAMHWGYHTSQPQQTQACDGKTCSCSSLHQSTFPPSGVKPISTHLHQPPLQPTCFVPADRYCHFYFLASILFLFNPLICFSPTLLISQSADFSSLQQ